MAEEDDLAGQSRAQLLEIARELGIRGRASLNKAGLVRAIRQARTVPPELPLEMMVEIARSATYSDIRRMCRASRALRGLCSGAPAYARLWEALWRRDFASNPALAEALSSGEIGLNPGDVLAQLAAVRTLADVAVLYMQPVSSWYAAYSAAVDMALHLPLHITVYLPNGIREALPLLELLRRRYPSYYVGATEAEDDPALWAESERQVYEVGRMTRANLRRLGFERADRLFRPANLPDG